MFSPLPHCQVPDSMGGDSTIFSGCKGMSGWVTFVFLFCLCVGVVATILETFGSSDGRTSYFKAIIAGRKTC